jgi:hypothetical protein
MKLQGMPETFWVVVKPSPVSELGDVCFPCDFKRFARQVRGGLDEESIVGIFVDEAKAVAEAKKLLAHRQEG